jgi:hypothetical protein
VALCALFSTVLLVLSQACTGAQQQQARQVFQLAEGGCAVLEGVTNDPRVANLCLSRDELAIALDAVLKARAAASAAVAGAPAPSASAPARAP